MPSVATSNGPLLLNPKRSFVTYVVNTTVYNMNLNVIFGCGKDAKKASVVTTVIGGCGSIALKEVVVVYSMFVVDSYCFVFRS